MKQGCESAARFSPAGIKLVGVFVAVLAVLFLCPPGDGLARSRLKEVGYVDGYQMGQKAFEEDPDLGWREYAAWARDRLKTIEPYPRHYVEGFEEGARDSYRGRTMDERPEEVDFSLRPPGALELLKRPEKE